jgi:undecaprenyl-diphosphatase
VSALTVFAWLGSHARRGEVGATEERVFRAVNSLPDGLAPTLWLLMQAGSLAGVGVVSALARASGRRALAWRLGTTGTVVWAGCKLVKRAIGRGRPAAHLDGVVVRGAAQSGLGYPSGHAAVAWTLAGLATPVLPAGGACAAWTVASLVGVARQYVGAHLPVDIAGGIAVGVAATAITPSLLRAESS